MTDPVIPTPDSGLWHKWDPAQWLCEACGAWIMGDDALEACPGEKPAELRTLLPKGGAA